jgi:ABC-type Fe3+-hydroxamate transport system substrate-binding protein
MKIFTDQLSNSIEIPFLPKRIISLVPSQTELLADLGLEQQVVGITKFCIHPESWRKNKAIIGGTKNFRFDVIDSLKPDLIIGNKEENYPQGIDQLRLQYPVWMSDIVSLHDALVMMEQIGIITNTSAKANVIIDHIKSDFESIQKLPERKTLYLIWKKPWMGAAPGTFIHELMIVAGLQNSLQEHTRYPELSAEDISRLNPEVIFLSSEPYPFQQQHIAELQLLCPQAKVILVDGEMFSWYGSRLLKFPAYLKLLSQVL